MGASRSRRNSIGRMTQFVPGHAASFPRNPRFSHGPLHPSAAPTFGYPGQIHRKEELESAAASTRASMARRIAELEAENRILHCETVNQQETIQDLQARRFEAAQRGVESGIPVLKEKYRTLIADIETMKTDQQAQAKLTAVASFLDAALPELQERARRGTDVELA